jgi:uncharacterized protein YbbC (DUF1343 family)
MTFRSAFLAVSAPALLVAACAPQTATTVAVPGPAVPAAATPATTGVELGIDVLLRDSLHVLRGKRVGLITNHTGRNARGETSIDLLHRAPGVNLVALFGPEHGIRGAAEAGEKVDSSIDQQTGLPVRSLYGATRVPTAEMLADIDVLVYDIQDVGARVYTYPWTMALAAEAAGKLGKQFVVLDRPDPVRADRVEGGMLDSAFRTFVGQYPVALRYGLTPGELMRFLVGTRQLHAHLTVIPMRGYRRSMWWEETGQPWISPSPNLRTLDAALLYTGTVFFEGTNLSEGRGTDRPFQLVGAAWLDAPAIAAALTARNMPGVRFSATTRSIAKGQKWGEQTIPMIQVDVLDREAIRPFEVGARMLAEIWSRHGKTGDMKWNVSHMDRLFGSQRLRLAVESGAIDALLTAADAESRAFARASSPYHLY